MNCKLYELEHGAAYVLADSAGPYRRGIDDPNHLEDTSEVFPLANAVRLCAICESSTGTAEALLDDRDVLVCDSCFEYETGESPQALRERGTIGSA